MHPKILVSGSTFERQFLDVLRRRGYEVEFHPEHLSEQALKAAIVDKDAFILGGIEFVSADILNSANKLKVIAVAAVGFQNYLDVYAASAKGVIVTNTPNANTRATAEMTISLITSLWRKIPYLNFEAKRGRWRDNVTSETLQDAVLGIIGAGAIGSEVAAIASFGLGMNIIYHSRSAKPQLEDKIGARRVSLHDLLATADVVSLHVPITKETKGLIGEFELNLMKSSAILVNTARPQIVSPDALLKALTSKSIAGCAMDGYYDEPPGREHDSYGLLSLSDEVFVLSPHVGYLTHQSIFKMSELAMQSVIDILEGKPWNYVVN